MRFEIEWYHPLFRPFLEELLTQEQGYTIPSDISLKDLALCVFDKKEGKMVGFVCAIVGLGELVYASHFVLDKKIRKTHHGNRVLKLLLNKFEESLKLIGKKSCNFFVEEKNNIALNFYRHIKGKEIGRGFLFNKKITEPIFSKEINV